MDELQIAICEDDKDEQKILVSLIKKSSFSSRILIFENGETFLKTYQSGIYDLIFMDIYMTDISGIDIVKTIRKKDKEVPIAFTTISKDHALDGYRLCVDRYIEKPIQKGMIDEVLNFAFQKKYNRPKILIVSHGKEISIPISQLMYVEQKEHYITFFLLGKRIIRVKGKLDELTPQLSLYSFCRCHKSFFVNFSFVKKIDYELMIFEMEEGNSVHIRRDSFKKVRETWETWLFETTRKMGENHE